MMNRLRIVTACGTALLIAAAVAVVVASRNRQQPAPPPDVPVAASPAEVRVKAVERKMEPVAEGEVAAASGAVAIVCGNDEATADRYEARNDALRSVARRRDLAKGDVDALMAYLRSQDDSGDTYVWDPSEFVATRPIAWSRNGVSRFYTHDGNKNASEAVSQNADIVAHYEYAPFGAVTVLRGTSAALNPWRFSSEYAEDDIMAIYYNYRHYEPATGRWLVRDVVEDLGSASFIAKTGSASQKSWIVLNSSELRNQIRASKVFRKAMRIKEHNRVGTTGDNDIALYLNSQNDLIDAYDELGAVAQWLAGCGLGACLGGIGGFIGGISRGWRSGLCGAATGAITGCAQGAVCASGSPQLCYYGSCAAGFLGSVANDLCVSGASLTDACSWFAAIMSGSMGCAASYFADAGGWKEKLVLFVLGGDVASWSSVCGDY